MYTGRLVTPTMRADYEDCELTELELTIESLQRDYTTLERPAADYRTPANAAAAGSLYYDDTLVANKGPQPVVYAQQNGDDGVYEDELVSSAGGAQMHSFAASNPTPSAGGTLQKRQLPALPEQTLGSSAYDRRDYLTPDQNGFQTSRKYYKDPSDRDSLMKALDTNKKSPSADAKFTRQPEQHSCCKGLAMLLLGVLLTAFYVAATYFVVKRVAVEICGESSNGFNGRKITIFYGEIEISRFNETWSSTIEFDSWFTSEMNEAVQDTILWDYWMNATVVGYTPPFSSWQNTTGRITCRFVLNLLLQPSRRRGVDAFAKHTIERRLPVLAPGGAFVRCVVFVEQDSVHDYQCADDVTAATTSSRRQNVNGR